jgi:hypothetical protein
MSSRRGVTNQVFAVTVIVLLVVAAAGFALYLTRPPAMESTTEAMTETATGSAALTTTESMNQSTRAAGAVQFTPATGQMLHTAWLVVSPTESGQYALAVYAQGLDSVPGSDYIVEGTQSSGSMAVVPIGPNATASEFDVGGNGVGSYFTVLGQNPFSNFESIEIVFLPGMQMTNTTVVATASLTMMAH